MAKYKQQGSDTENNTTKQVGEFPNKATQFGQPNGNPRHNGAWKKEDSPRFKLEKMMNLSIKDLEVIVRDEDAPLFERKLAKAIVEDDWKTYREMMHEVYGTPKQSVDVTSGGDKIKTVVEIIDARSKSTDS